ncbi:hypothetical protein Cme02nite_07510 [Catellatospora methionotrophica]|uniref:DUF402 domain-containing protein n=1 Tax=Catellatospora methionotrophica TaxID=121620 RepID=A0A8J3L6H3_9ACTN|nr:hypothetical protein Cme02nite_07510 [Catellatospora methionotrophica]
MVTFEPGELVCVRHFQNLQVGGLYPMRAVRHDERGLLLWCTRGTYGWHLNRLDDRHMSHVPLAEWVTGPKRPMPFVARHGVLSWHPAGADYSVRWFFDTDGRFRNWYANLERPGIAWRDPLLAGLDTADWDLDVWIDADRTWRWKDEDVFAERLTQPEHYWVDDEARVRRAGREIIDLVEAAAFPFDGTWCDFRPDPAWTAETPDTPPPGWDRPRAW